MKLDEKLLLFCAFRYALGRRSYIVEAITDILIKRRKRISKIDKEKYVQEIKEAEKRDLLGSEHNKADWMRVKFLFESDLS
jgi:hypothetical protein